MDIPLSKTDIRQRYLRRARQLILVLGILIVILLAIRWLFTPNVERADIRTAKTSTGTITATINAGGVVVPLVEQTISSEIDSQIVRVFTQVGTSIKKGEPLLQLATQRIDLAIETIKEKLALKDSQIQSKRLTFKQAENDINSRFALLQVDLESRGTKADRLEQLNITSASSRHELLEAQLNVKRTKIELQQLVQAKLDLQSTVDAEIDALKLEKSLLERELTEQHRLLKAATVLASRDGIVSWIKQETGASVAPSEPLARVADASQFRIEASLSDFYAAQLVPNMPAQIRYNGKIISGRLTSSTPTIQDGVMKLIIALDESHHSDLYHNLRVDVGLVVDSVSDAITLAKGPYIAGQGLQQVFVIRDDTAYKTEIRVGMSNTEQYQILNGLQHGEEVIISDVSDMLHLNQFSLH